MDLEFWSEMGKNVVRGLIGSERRAIITASVLLAIVILKHPLFLENAEVLITNALLPLALAAAIYHFVIKKPPKKDPPKKEGGH